MNKALSAHLRLCLRVQVTNPLLPFTKGCHFVLPVDELPLKTPNYIIFLLRLFHYTVIKGIPKSLSCLPETVPHLPKHRENSVLHGRNITCWSSSRANYHRNCGRNSTSARPQDHEVLYKCFPLGGKSSAYLSKR